MPSFVAHNMAPSHLRIPTRAEKGPSTALIPFSIYQQRDNNATSAEVSLEIPSMNAFGKRRAVSPRTQEDNDTTSAGLSRTDSPWKKALRRKEAQEGFTTDPYRTVMTWEQQNKLEKAAARSLYRMKMEDTLMGSLRCRVSGTSAGEDDRESSVDISDRHARDATEAACTDAEDDVASGRRGEAAYDNAHYTIRSVVDYRAQYETIAVADEGHSDSDLEAARRRDHSGLKAAKKYDTSNGVRRTRLVNLPEARAQKRLTGIPPSRRHPALAPAELKAYYETLRHAPGRGRKIELSEDEPPVPASADESSWREAYTPFVRHQDEGRNAILASRVGDIITPPPTPTPKTSQKQKLGPSKKHEGFAPKRQISKLNCPTETQAACSKGGGDVAATVGLEGAGSEAHSMAPMQTRGKRVLKTPKRLEAL